MRDTNEKISFATDKDGFYGTYCIAPQGSDCVMIGLFGDAPDDLMAKCGAKWLHRLDLNVMAILPAKKDHSHVNLPLYERYPLDLFLFLG